MWSSGKRRGQACDTLAGFQDMQPNLCGHLQGSWHLLKAWSVNEIPNRAPPLPEHLVLTLMGWVFFKGEFTFEILLLVGFYTMLRTGAHGAAENVILGYQPAVTLVKYWKSIASPEESCRLAEIV